VFDRVCSRKTQKHKFIVHVTCNDGLSNCDRRTRRYRSLASPVRRRASRVKGDVEVGKAITGFRSAPMRTKIRSNGNVSGVI